MTVLSPVTGRIDIDAATEGTVAPIEPSFGYGWADIRQPRTMVGVDGEGPPASGHCGQKLSPGVSQGFTLVDEARFLRSLGAVEAMNLDGGGSTAMAVDGRLVNVPSDSTRQRAVGDTVLVLPPVRH